MGAPKAADWRKLPLSLTELCIDTTLRCGQSFRWRKISDEWHCVLRGRIISLKQDSSHLHYRATWPATASSLQRPAPPPSPRTKTKTDGGEENDGTASLLHNYFALSHSLTVLYDQWAASDANFARRAPAFTGIRILNQDPWEALVAFICSSNNNISRITQMVLKLCLHYGPYIGTIEGEPFHDFPGPEALSGAKVEAHLRELGFGYRAKYIAETARIVSAERPAGWLPQLRNPASPALGKDTPTIKPEAGTDDPEPATYRAAHSSLLELTGVGPKVADCVCLMGLGWGEAVPVDTHVWQIAQRDYKFGKSGGGGKSKTFTKTMYDAVGDHFRAIWGPQAGWAQSVLFTANLKSFAEQAQGAGGSGVKGVVKTEGDEVGKPLGLSENKMTVKAEDEEKTVASTTAGRARKRKVAAVDEKTTETTQMDSRPRRTSKRIKTAVK